MKRPFFFVSFLWAHALLKTNNKTQKEKVLKKEDVLMVFICFFFINN